MPFPGAGNPDAFWQLLLEGRDAVGASTQRGADLPPAGLLEQVDQFDAAFFGISAREAESMDPQQRLLLEVAWETLEHAGIAPGSLAGGRTAVIVGISNSDYIRLAQDEVADVGPYVATGNALSVAANRISYALDLRGRAGRSIPHVRRRSSRCIRRAARCSAASPTRRWPAGST